MEVQIIQYIYEWLPHKSNISESDESVSNWIYFWGAMELQILQYI